MGALKTIKRLAADILGIGILRVRIRDGLAESERKQLEEAITRQNVRDLIADGIIKKKPAKGRVAKPKGRKKRTIGNRRGTPNALIREKDRWMERVRAQRKYLKTLIRENKLPKEHKNIIYMKIKGGSFKSKSALTLYLRENRYIKE